MDRWTFLTNHAHVLLCISADPEIRLRDVAERVGITERATQRIVADLVEAGYVASRKNGRRNHYEVNANLPFRHPVENHRNVGVLLHLLRNGEADTGRRKNDAGERSGVAENLQPPASSARARR